METVSINAIESLKGEVIKNRKEIKSAIEATEARLLMKVEELEQKVHHLEKENQTFKDKVKTLDRSSRRNNIIVFGLNNKDNSPNTLSKRLKYTVGSRCWSV